MSTARGADSSRRSNWPCRWACKASPGCIPTSAASPETYAILNSISAGSNTASSSPSIARTPTRSPARAHLLGRSHQGHRAPLHPTALPTPALQLHADVRERHRRPAAHAPADVPRRPPRNGRLPGRLSLGRRLPGRARHGKGRHRTASCRSPGIRSGSISGPARATKAARPSPFRSPWTTSPSS